jgi:simple sugar transport system permease protein
MTWAHRRRVQERLTVKPSPARWWAMHDVRATAIADRTAPEPAPAGRRFGRLTLDIRQHLSPWKQAAFLTVSLAIGLAIAVGILAIAGIAPGTLFEEIATAFNADSLRAVLVRAAPLILVGLAAARFPRRLRDLGLEGQMIFGGIAAAGVSITGSGRKRRDCSWACRGRGAGRCWPPG